MNNIKKTGLGMLVATLAFGFSAFTTVTRGTVVTYYKTNTTYSSPSDARGYQYYSDDRCMPSGTVCTAKWDIGTNTSPSIDGTNLPTTGVTYQSNSAVTGHFE